MDFSLLIPLFAGWLAGALVNYAADVLPETRRFSAPVCKHCDAPIRWTSYLLLRPCASCGKARGLRAWITQGLGVAAAFSVWAAPPPKLGFWLSLILLVYLGIVFVIDVEYRAVLDEVSIVGAVGMAVLGIWLQGWKSTLLGGAAGFLMMYALYGLGVLFLRWKNRKEKVLDEEDDVALGFGDVKLAGVLGLLVGWPHALGMVLLALLFGGIIGFFIMLALLARKKSIANAAMPYAPYLVLAACYFIFLL